MDVVAVLLLGVVATGVLTGAAYVGARWLRRRHDALDTGLAPIEAHTGLCGACDGKGFRIDNYGLRAAPTTCFRCGGSGKPPA